ncbi:MAG: hypothetical protein WAM60_25480 [Candidatus Promineifilaceae bacterium]
MVGVDDAGLITDSLREFMGELIDYAGLFPPAGLPLAEAIENYGRYRQRREAWMLGRFVIPARMLDELTAMAGDRFVGGGPYRFSILGRGGKVAAEFLEGVQADIAAVEAFREAHGAGVSAEFYEVRLPEAVVAGGDVMEMNGMLAAAGGLLAAGGLRPFYEATLGATWRDMVDSSVHAIAAYNHATGQRVGFKLRCGGLDAAAFPSQYQVAHVIAACRDSAVPMKCTAGLHHPIRHYDGGVQTKLHGFVNVFAAGILAEVYDLPEHEIAAVVADENPTHFVFTDKMFTWLDRVVSASRVRAVRQENMISFGSCSFEEPLEDMQLLDWLVDVGFGE